jgi:hypothetical protein
MKNKNIVYDNNGGGGVISCCPYYCRYNKRKKKAYIVVRRNPDRADGLLNDGVDSIRITLQKVASRVLVLRMALHIRQDR